MREWQERLFAGRRDGDVLSDLTRDTWHVTGMTPWWRWWHSSLQPSWQPSWTPHDNSKLVDLLTITSTTLNNLSLLTMLFVKPKPRFEIHNLLCLLRILLIHWWSGKGTIRISPKLWSSGKGKGQPRKVTQRSFIDGGWWMVDILSLMLYTKFGCHPPASLLISRIKLIMDQVR